MSLLRLLAYNAVSRLDGWGWANQLTTSEHDVALALRQSLLHLFLIRTIIRTVAVPRSVGRLMYVCICNRVTDSDIRRAVLEGTSRLKRLQRRLQVGADCGSCLEEALRRALDERRVRSLGVSRT
ncbi:MAG: (2Fe-2S)-binding protein [Gammaproteobacteria bacterium]